MDRNNKMLTMVIVDGFFVLGKLEGTRLHLPRVFEIIKDGAEFSLKPFPLVPLFINLTPGYFSYPIPIEEKNLTALWERVTDPVQIKMANQTVHGTSH